MAGLLTVTAPLVRDWGSPWRLQVRVTRKLMKTRPTALDSHKRFMHQLTRGARQRKAAKAAAAAGQQQAQQSLKDFTARLRSDILSGITHCTAAVVAVPACWPHTPAGEAQASPAIGYRAAWGPARHPGVARGCRRCGDMASQVTWTSAPPGNQQPGQLPCSSTSSRSPQQRRLRRPGRRSGRRRQLSSGQLPSSCRRRWSAG